MNDQKAPRGEEAVRQEAAEERLERLKGRDPGGDIEL